MFSKKAAFDENLSVFGSGSQIKPLASVTDLSRFIRLIIEKNYNKEIFHFVNEHKTVKEIAEIVQQANPKIKIFHTNDEIPNDGYYVSNEKLLKTGFIFNTSLRYEVYNMINNWKNHG